MYDDGDQNVTSRPFIRRTTTEEPSAPKFRLNSVLSDLAHIITDTQATIILLSLVALALAGLAIGRHRAHADATLKQSLDAPQVRDQLLAQLKIPARTAGSRHLLPGSARPYVEARRALSRGEPETALKLLSHNYGHLFLDREELVRGEALLALGKIKLAIESFEKALSNAYLPPLAEAAVEGLASAYGRLAQFNEAHAFIDTLLEYRNRSRPNPRFLLSKAKLFAASGQYQAALDLASRVVRDYPASRQLAPAKMLITKMVQQGAKPEPITPETLMKQAEAWVRSRKYKDAQAALDQLPSSLKTQLLEARILAGQGLWPEATQRFKRLSKRDMPDDIAGEALHHLARRLLDIDENDQAQDVFDQLVKYAPRSKRARNAEFYGGWIAHDEGRYKDAVKRMYRYAARHRRASDRDEALWFAGWSNYLSNNLPKARSDLQKLLSEHKRSNLVPQAYYWLGRIAQRQRHLDEAELVYKKVLNVAPFNYHAVWANQRLKEMQRKPVELTSAPKDLLLPQTLDSALEFLGPNRPATIDRAILLFNEDRPGEVNRELSQALTQISPSDKKTRAQVADMLNHLGAHYLGFRTSQRLLGSGKDLEAGDTTTWLAWRQAFPKAYLDEVNEAHAEHHVPREIIWAIMRTETHYRPQVTSRVGAGGVMQVMPKTAQLIGKTATGGLIHASRYLEPASNIWLGTWYLGGQLKRYGQQLAPMAAAYNAGPTAVDRWLEAFNGAPLDEFIERIPYRETRRYVKRVIETWAIYHHLYGNTIPNLPVRAMKSIAEDSLVNF